MLRVVKQCLGITLGRSHHDYFELVTLLESVADAINNRPLTYVSSEDEITPITPNSFIKPHSRTSVVYRDRGSDDDFWPDADKARASLIRSFNVASEKYENFKSRWYNEYLLSLRETSKDLYQISWENVVKVNDVVLIKSRSIHDRTGR